MKLNVQLINTPEGLEAIRDGWQRLTLSSPDNTLVFTSWDYVHAYVSSLRPPGWLVVAMFEEGSTSPSLSIPCRSIISSMRRASRAPAGRWVCPIFPMWIFPFAAISAPT